MRRIGLYGGTFDPVHRGHLEPVRVAADLIGWDEVVFIPAWRQPFKSGAATAPAHHRFAMLALATQRDERFVISPVELQRSETSYTIDTLREIRAGARDAILDWVIGEDNVDALPLWRAFGEILELANFVVLRRAGESSAPEGVEGHRSAAETIESLWVDSGARPPQGRLIPLDTPRVDVSATEIRRRLAAEESIDGMVDPAVEEYIRKHRLYRPRVG